MNKQRKSGINLIQVELVSISLIIQHADVVDYCFN